MKKLSMLFIAAIATLTAWAQVEESAGSTKVNTDFSKYRTFGWAKSDPTVAGPMGYDIYYYEITPEKPGEIDMERRPDPHTNKPSGHIYSYNVIIPASDDATNTLIRTDIADELIGRGYRENDADPDLLVVYQVFDQKAQLHGYTPTDAAGTPGQQTRQPSDTTTFILEPGTLMVSLVDAKTSEMVWNGFASGMVNNRAFTSDEAELKEAIHSIFENFRHTADNARRD